MTWFLVMIATAQSIGPLDEQACKMAGTYLTGHGVECRQANAMAVCDVPTRPETYTLDLIFAHRWVNVKE
jgi:hypothetical protein